MQARLKHTGNRFLLTSCGRAVAGGLRLLAGREREGPWEVGPWVPRAARHHAEPQQAASEDHTGVILPQPDTGRQNAQPPQLTLRYGATIASTLANQTPANSSMGMCENGGMSSNIHSHLHDFVISFLIFLHFTDASLVSVEVPYHCPVHVEHHKLILF